MVLDKEATRPGQHWLFGYPLKRTYAPFLHNTLTRLAGVQRNYAKWETQDINDIMEAIKKPEFAGSAVTMPHKVAVCKLVDELTEEAKAIGASNTIYYQEKPDGSRKLIGHNTDTVGIRESFLQSGQPLLTKTEQRPGMIMGGGGASRSAVFALAVYLNCSPIYVVNRDDTEVADMLADFKKNATENFHPEMLHIKTVEEAAKLPAPAYIVSAIPDYPPSTPQEKLARNIFETVLDSPEKGQILEMCYNPRVWSDIAETANTKGWHVITGEVAMIWQGIEQQKIWLGCNLEDLPIKETLALVSAQVKKDTETGSDPPQQ